MNILRVQGEATPRAGHPVGLKARLALDLLLYTLQRRDALLLGKQHLRKGVLYSTQYKSRNKKPISLEIPIHPRL